MIGAATPSRGRSSARSFSISRSGLRLRCQPCPDSSVEHPASVSVRGPPHAAAIGWRTTSRGLGADLRETLLRWLRHGTRSPSRIVGGDPKAVGSTAPGRTVSVELAPEHPPHRDRIEIDRVQAADVDTPSGEWRCASGGLLGCPLARTPEGKNAAGGTEVVLGGSRVPLVQSEVLERGEEPEPVRLDSVNERAAPAANRAVARSNVVQVEVHLEPHATAVAGPLVGLHVAHTSSRPLCPTDALQPAANAIFSIPSAREEAPRPAPRSASVARWSPRAAVPSRGRRREGRSNAGPPRARLRGGPPARPPDR